MVPATVGEASRAAPISINCPAEICELKRLEVRTMVSWSLVRSETARWTRTERCFCSALEAARNELTRVYKRLF